MGQVDEGGGDLSERYWLQADRDTKTLTFAPSGSVGGRKRTSVEPGGHLQGLMHHVKLPGLSSTVQSRVVHPASKASEAKSTKKRVIDTSAHRLSRFGLILDPSMSHKFPNDAVPDSTMDMQQGLPQPITAYPERASLSSALHLTCLGSGCRPLGATMRPRSDCLAPPGPARQAYALTLRWSLG